jgi:hypothetical protein
LSHIVTIQTKLHDSAAIAAACQRLNPPAPELGTAKLFSGEVTGQGQRALIGNLGNL